MREKTRQGPRVAGDGGYRLELCHLERYEMKSFVLMTEFVMIEVRGLEPDVFSAVITYVFLTKCVKEINSRC
jgi:hypothetical protein